MNYKGLAAAVFLSATLANTAMASTKSIASHSSAAQFQSQDESTAMRRAEIVKVPAGQDNPVEFNLLNTICIVSLAVAGLLLLKRVQGE